MNINMNIIHPVHSLLKSPHNGVTFEVTCNNDHAEIKIFHSTGSIIPTLVKLEKLLTLNGFKTLQIKLTDISANHQHSLARLLYHTTDQQLFSKPLTFRPSVRFSITEQCNFHCFFCHEEGLEMETRRHSASKESIFALLAELKEQVIDDFTFTGGEPLLKWKLISTCLDEMERINYLPEITLVTNAERLTVSMLDRLQRYPGKVRFNLSIHSLDPERYLQIVHRMKGKPMGSVALLEQTQQKIELIRKANIPFKLNIVLLRGINTEKTDLLQMLNYGVTSGATAVKFLELLITEKLQNFYPYYYHLNNVALALQEQLTLMSESFRRKQFWFGPERSQQQRLIVELQQCTCAQGCDVCNLNRDVNVTAELSSFPCFLHPEKHFYIKEQGLSDCLKQGEFVVEEMAKRYGSESPILIQNAKICSEEQAYYYPITEQQLERLNAVLNVELQQTRMRHFSEIFYASDKTQLHTDQQFIKLSQNSYDTEALMVHKHVTIDINGCQHTQFLSKGQRIKDIAIFDKQLEKEQRYPVLCLNWEIDYYRSPIGPVSLGYNRESGIKLLRTSTPLIWLTEPLQPLMQPPVHYILDRITQPTY